MTTILRSDREEAFRCITEQTGQHEPAMERLIRQLQRFVRGEITEQEVVRSVTFGDVEIAIVGRIEERVAERFTPPASDLLHRAYTDAGVAAAARSVFDLGFEPAATRALRYADQNAARLVTGVTSETINAIRDQITRSIRTGEAPRIAAARLRPMIGLTRGHAAAVDRFYAKSIERGVAPSRAARNASAYARRLLNWRADNIARTEMLTAANAGQFEYFQQLADAGFIDRATIVKEWVTAQDDRTCDQCAPMDGMQVVSLDEQFVSRELGLNADALRPRPNGAVFRDYPPLHNMCRCTIIIL